MPETNKPKRGQPLSVDVLAQTAVFRALTPKMQAWLLAYCRGFLNTGVFDGMSATRAAYTLTHYPSIKATTHRLTHNTKVQSVVHLFLNSGTVPDLAFDLAEIQKQIEACEPGGIAAQRLIVLKARIKRALFAGSEDDEPEQEPEPQAAPVVPAADSRVPAGCRAIRNKTTKRVVAYLTPDGQRVNLADVEVSQ